MFLYGSNIADTRRHDNASHATNFRENCARALRFLRKKERNPKPESDTTPWKTSLFYFFHYFSSTRYYNLVTDKGKYKWYIKRMLPHIKDVHAEVIKRKEH